jgi:hypothetical protein
MLPSRSGSLTDINLSKDIMRIKKSCPASTIADIYEALNGEFNQVSGDRNLSLIPFLFLTKIISEHGSL